MQFTKVEYVQFKKRDIKTTDKNILQSEIKNCR